MLAGNTKALQNTYWYTIQPSNCQFDDVGGGGGDVEAEFPKNQPIDLCCLVVNMTSNSSLDYVKKLRVSLNV